MIYFLCMKKWRFYISIFALLLASINFTQAGLESYALQENFAESQAYTAEQIVVVERSQERVSILPGASYGGVVFECTLENEVDLGFLQTTLTPLELNGCTFPSLSVNIANTTASAIAVSSLNSNDTKLVVQNVPEVFFVRYVFEGLEVGQGLLTEKDVLASTSLTYMVKTGSFLSLGETGQMESSRLALATLQVWRC